MYRANCYHRTCEAIHWEQIDSVHDLIENQEFSCTPPYNLIRDFMIQFIIYDISVHKSLVFDVGVGFWGYWRWNSLTPS